MPSCRARVRRLKRRLQHPRRHCQLPGDLPLRAPPVPVRGRSTSTSRSVAAPQTGSSTKASTPRTATPLHRRSSQEPVHRHATAVTRGAPRPTTKSEASIEAREIEELESKLADGDVEAQSLRAQIASHEKTISDIRDQVANHGVAQGNDEDKLVSESADLSPTRNRTMNLPSPSLSPRLVEAGGKMQARDTELKRLKADLVESIATRDATQSQLDSLKATLEQKREQDETALKKAWMHRYQTGELRASLVAEHSSVSQNSRRNTNGT